MTTPPLYRLALHGFEQARARLIRGLAETPSASTALVSASEAAYWAVALHERLRSDDASYKSLNGRGPDLLDAVKWVRNRSAHQIPMTVETTGGIRFPIVFPLTVQPVVVRWATESSLPPEDPKYRSPRGRQGYRDILEGRPVVDSFARVAEWFAVEAARPGTLIAP
ncbi:MULTISPECIES: hypothetical protein [unclassified Streptomyces]|uniref:hypothetical protein n=1 Tax=unclassified Streptomyces TaxID=2593676 RepID=UPI0003784534|nr:hypothetical protein [Streptomyces sp. LaPpAH-202]MYW61338.1 hypothetical protein [Streptomyces sp. SID8370]MYW87285.1 hypothetical protein [Streptomyces sp. SID8371]